jgi:predicted CoA-binding protein
MREHPRRNVRVITRRNRSPVDIVDVFRRSDAAAGVAREAADMGAGALWLQEGVVGAEAREIAREAEMDYFENVCIKKLPPSQNV